MGNVIAGLIFVGILTLGVGAMKECNRDMVFIEKCHRTCVAKYGDDVTAEATALPQKCVCDTARHVVDVP